LAHKAAMRLVPGNRREKERAAANAFAHYEIIVSRAMVSDANEYVPDQDDDSSLVRART
jgi:hypothetical protein